MTRYCEDLENITKSHENQRSDILLNEIIINEKVSEFSSFFIRAATKSTNDRKNISNKPNYQKKRKKEKLWHDNECEVKYRHVKNLARSLSNNPWDKI